MSAPTPIELLAIEHCGGISNLILASAMAGSAAAVGDEAVTILFARAAALLSQDGGEAAADEAAETIKSIFAAPTGVLRLKSAYDRIDAARAVIDGRPAA